MTTFRNPRRGQTRGRIEAWMANLPDDPYALRAKPAGPAICEDCGAVFRHGRWTWSRVPAGAGDALCPACRRIREKVPAGTLELSGGFLVAHFDEILQLVRNVEKRERAAHPLKRILDFVRNGDTATLTVTEPHLARAIGTALHDAFGGDLELDYQKGEYHLRATWSRDS